MNFSLIERQINISYVIGMQLTPELLFWEEAFQELNALFTKYTIYRSTIYLDFYDKDNNNDRVFRVLISSTTTKNSLSRVVIDSHIRRHHFRLNIHNIVAMMMDELDKKHSAILNYFNISTADLIVYFCDSNKLKIVDNERI